ncbi:hypothetical protein THAOC_26736, partial [Thalassiosira oceanica]
ANGDVGKNSSSSERGGGAGRKTSLGNERGTTSEFREGRPYYMFDIVAMRQGKAAGGGGAKVVGNEREGRAKGAPPAEVGWTGEGGGWVGAR